MILKFLIYEELKNITLKNINSWHNNIIALFILTVHKELKIFEFFHLNQLENQLIKKLKGY